jgi:hypothetical protein
VADTYVLRFLTQEVTTHGPKSTNPGEVKDSQDDELHCSICELGEEEYYGEVDISRS